MLPQDVKLERKSRDTATELEDIPNRRQDPRNTTVLQKPEVPRHSILKPTDFWFLVGIVILIVILVVIWVAKKKSSADLK